VLETEPIFVSILGTPWCGKSFFLTAMTWELRTLLPRSFALSFADADPTANRTLNEYEESLFLHPRADDLIPVANLIRKTAEVGELYDTVSYGNQVVSYPRPFLFALHPQTSHPRYLPEGGPSRLLCLYDNAGESFLPGKDSTGSPLTQHLARSRLLLFLFDPTQDQRFRKLCYEGRPAPPRSQDRITRQEPVLHEAAERVRRYAGLPAGARYSRPLIVVVTKCDAWKHLLEHAEAADPWVQTGALMGVDLLPIERRSDEVRGLLMRVCPEIVTAAEGFADSVVYVPVSALGRTPEPHPELGQLAVRPHEIRPIWATVPLLYGLAKWVSGIVPRIKRKPSSGARPLKVNELPDGY
jgi:hypothetical protein